MDHQNFRTLQILEEIENSYGTSQRELAGKLNVSLGLVNSFMKRLAHKGYLKVTTIPKNRVKYILTPKGAAEKTRLTYHYIQYSFQFYRRARKKLRLLFQDLANQSVHSLIFYGAGELAEIAYVSLQETPIKLKAVSDDQKIGERFFGHIIIDPAGLTELSFDRILITDVDSSDTALESLLNKGFSSEKVVMLK
ncbi:MAG TPA: winged helix-turn-helix transcriptional regulator [Desulfobacterales bacterium]|nr:winged helix-turn-helix transcriptional regulator [Desulfobacterales bacterium]